MKTLLILRHGKSSWADARLDDHDRPLKGRGKRAAERIGKALRARGLVPDLIVSSTARRARATAKRAARAAGYEGRILRLRELYFCELDKQLETLAGHAGKDVEKLMVVGHNPDLERLVAELTGERVVLTTANLARIDLDVDAWSELPSARGRLRFVLRPRELPD